MCANEDGCWLDPSGRDRKSKRISRFSSLVKDDRQVTIAAGGMYPDSGILRRRSSTRSLVVKSSVGADPYCHPRIMLIILLPLELRDRVCQISFVNLPRFRFHVFTRI